MVVLLLGNDVLRLNPAEKAASQYIYSLVDWEASNILSKWLHRLASVAPWGSSHGLGRRALVEKYFRLGGEISSLKERIRQEAARSSSNGADPVMRLEEELHEVRSRRNSMRNAVEEVIEATISAALARIGLATWGRFVYPPVDIRLDEPPKVLVTSPRDKIMRAHEALLDPRISVAQSVSVETALMENDDLSALVEGVGGIATYPAFVTDSAPMRATFKTAAHEWMHHYLVAHLRPLGLKMFSSPEMQTINETLADIAGDEIGGLAFDILSGQTGPPQSANPGPPKGPDDVEGEKFDFGREMRKTRLRVDRLLADGEVNEAEAYMEERRKMFVENGFFIRKINQAYFAINGTYAEQPESSSPIGAQLREIRELIPSLNAFITTVARVSSHRHFLETLEMVRAASAR